jgi:hypothetical protein
LCLSAAGEHVQGFVSRVHFGPARNGDQGRVVDE